MIATPTLANEALLDSNADEIIKLSAATELANAKTLAAKARYEARQAERKLSAPIKTKNAIERTTTTTLLITPIDNIELKSLVTTNGITTAWIALEGELIEVKKGSKVGGISIISLNESSVLFSDGHRQKRKWMAGFKADAVSLPQGTRR